MSATCSFYFEVIFQKTRLRQQQAWKYRPKAKANAILITQHGGIVLVGGVMQCIQKDFVPLMVAMVTIGLFQVQSTISRLTVSLHGPVRSVGVMVISPQLTHRVNVDNLLYRKKGV